MYVFFLNRIHQAQLICMKTMSGLDPVAATKEQYIYPKVSSLQREVYEETEDAIKKAVSHAKVSDLLSNSFTVKYCI